MALLFCTAILGTQLLNSNYFYFFLVVQNTPDAKMETKFINEDKENMGMNLEMSMLHWLTVLSTSFGKTFFAWRFILNENILFWLTIPYQKPFVFSVAVFCSHIRTLKLNLSPKIGLIYAISIVKWFFGIFVLVNIFYFSLLNLNYWCFTTILWKFQKNWTSESCWKSASKLPTLQISA